ncbi:MAG: glycosyltransferase family 2 protein [Acidiferrobacterales bacterium]|nr:glycosyltransferase family 2 protein [Acidiferrobacterales bacterium]
MKDSACRSSTKLLLVVVNYHSADLVSKLVHQLTLQAFSEKISLSIICVDNSVSDLEAKKLKLIRDESKLPFELIINTENMGYGNAINLAAVGKDFDYLCCLNPDIELQQDTLSKLLNHGHLNQNQGIWGGLTVDSNGTPDFRHAWQEPSIKNTLGWALGLKHLSRSPSWHETYHHKGKDAESAYPVDSVSGCCLMISRKLWQTLNGFDSDFLLYSEEIDLCRRARLEGYQPTVIPTAKFFHAKHANKGSARRIPLIYASKHLYANKHHGLLYVLAYRCLIFLGAMIRIIKSMITLDGHHLKAWLRVAVQSITYTKSRLRL